MAATTIAAYSTELTQGLPPLYNPLKPNLREGRMRIAVFNYTFASQAAGLIVALCEIPAGARIIGGTHRASATLANSATTAIGLMAKDASGFLDVALAVSDNTAYLKAAAALGTTQVPFAITAALGYLYETEKPLFLTLLTGTGTVATETLSGHIEYVVD